jgi:hypothetical protein
MTAEDPLAELRAGAYGSAPDPPGLDQVIEDIGLQRLAAYYLYCALLAGLISDHGLALTHWPPELAEPMQRLGLTGFAPSTGRGLDAELTPAEQALRRSAGRQLEFAQLLVDLINHGAFGPLCGDADRVRLARSRERRGMDLELIKGPDVVGACPVRDHWELVAQHLAGVPVRGPLARAGSARVANRTLARRTEDSGVAHAVSLTVTLAVGLQPVGTIAGLGTRLIRARIQAGHDQADALNRLGQDLRSLYAQADGELARRSA